MHCTDLFSFHRVCDRFSALNARFTFPSFSFGQSIHPFSLCLNSVPELTRVHSRSCELLVRRVAPQIEESRRTWCSHSHLSQAEDTPASITGAYNSVSYLSGYLSGYADSPEPFSTPSVHTGTLDLLARLAGRGYSSRPKRTRRVQAFGPGNELE
jgi:hypothetical protein